MLNDHPTQGEAVEREIKDKGRQAAIHLADVSVETDVKAMIAESGKLGSADVVGGRRARFSAFYLLIFTTRSSRWLQIHELLTPSHSLTVSNASVITLRRLIAHFVTRFSRLGGFPPIVFCKCP